MAEESVSVGWKQDTFLDIVHQATFPYFIIITTTEMNSVMLSQL